jgi:hypothetical protein
MFENRVLRRIFGPGREEMIGGCRSCMMRGFIICRYSSKTLIN